MMIHYDDPAFHVLARKALPDALTTDLNANPAWMSWRSLKQSQPPVAFWLQMHQSFLKTIAQIEAVSGSLLDVSEGDLVDGIRASNLLEGSQQLFLGLQQHHIMEDQVYFPKFITLIPRLKAPMEMLDQDHIVLDQLTDDANSVLDKLATAKPKPGDVADFHAIAQRLAQGLSTHIRDEEDIVMPDLLEIGVERLMAI